MRAIAREALIILGIILLGCAAIVALNYGVDRTLGGVTPMLCWGEVYIDGSFAPIGTEVDVFIGDSSTPSGTYTTTTTGQYGAFVVTGDESLYGQPLVFQINGRAADKIGGDEGLFGLENQIVNIATAIQTSKVWEFNAPGYVPRHLPDAFMGSVDLSEVEPPPEVQGVYKFQDDWVNPELGKWLFWGPGAPGTTLSELRGGLFADYTVAVTGACEWEIELK